jgi:hypothetical protein
MGSKNAMYIEVNTYGCNENSVWGRKVEIMLLKSEGNAILLQGERISRRGFKCAAPGLLVWGDLVLQDLGDGWFSQCGL